MKNKIGFVIVEPNQNCDSKEKKYIWSQYVYKLWQIKQRIEKQAV